MVINPKAIVASPVMKRDDTDEVIRYWEADDVQYITESVLYTDDQDYHMLDDMIVDMEWDLEDKHVNPGHFCVNTDVYVELQAHDCPFCDGQEDLFVTLEYLMENLGL